MALAAPAASALTSFAQLLSGRAEDYDGLLDLIGDSRFVLLGEASHGTHEFYRERARITRRLIEEKGFSAVAVEADWPDAYRVNRWVRGLGQDRNALEALGDFHRFPRWMWRNRDVLECIEWLLELLRRAAELSQKDGQIPEEDFFYAEQNARLVKNAEEYYRTMFRGRDESWNLRDRHMVDTLEELRRFLGRTRPEPRIVVWAHNSHLGDARATEMSERGELNVGQLVRERYGASAVLVGFTTFTGTVTAASEWDGPAHRKHVALRRDNRP